MRVLYSRMQPKKNPKKPTTRTRWNYVYECACIWYVTLVSQLSRSSNGSRPKHVPVRELSAFYFVFCIFSFSPRHRFKIEIL